MITREKIREEIHDLMEKPMCEKHVELLAQLMYIDEHMHHCDRKKEWGWGNKWVDGMKNADGTVGAHWTMEQVEEVARSQGFKGNTWLLWIAMNAEYSDRCEVYRKHGITSAKMYYDQAVAFWLEDEDAVDEKLWAYYENVVKC